MTGTKADVSELQEMPTSAVTFNPMELQREQINDIRDLSSYTPNLEIKTAFAASNPVLFIRGVGLDDFNANSGSAVAVYQDGIYMNSPAGQLFQFFDSAGVEVLRGPQGGRYRNATAGAIWSSRRSPRTSTRPTGPSRTATTTRNSSRLRSTFRSYRRSWPPAWHSPLTSWTASPRTAAAARSSSLPTVRAAR